MSSTPPTHDEQETKYDLDAAFQVPELLGLVPAPVDGAALRVGHAEDQQLEATYFDTADLRLARSSLTLRRRTGGADAGWHLKVPRAGKPSGPGTVRTEVTLPLGRAVSTVPVALRRMVRARTGGLQLVPVARIVTRRTVRHLLDGTGRVLLELADDRVEAQRLHAQTAASNEASAGTRLSWRELEVELVDGDRQLLEAVDAGLLGLGLRRGGSTSKLARVLGDEGTAPAPTRRKLSPKSSAGEVVVSYLAAQVEEVLVHDVHVRLDNPDSVHKMRVATRRLRSALQTYEPLVERDAVRPLRAELKWLAGELGTVRDAEVRRERLGDALAADDEHLPRTAPQDVDGQLSTTYRTAHDHLLQELDSERYSRLLAAMSELVGAPPVSDRADRKAAKVLPSRVARTYSKLEKTVDAARGAAGERGHELHEARKAAKRARYAAEVLVPAFGKDASRLAAAMEEVQEELGEHQDSIVLRERLEELAAQASDPRTVFALGRLHALEQAHGKRSQDRFGAVWKRSSRKSLRRWLR